MAMLRHIDKFLPNESQQIQLIVPQYINPTLYNIHALVLKSKKKKKDGSGWPHLSKCKIVNCPWAG